MPPAHLITGVYYKKKGNSVVTATKGKEMEHLEEFLRGTALFKGVPGEGMARLLRHLQGAVHTYEKQQDVLHEGQHAASAGIVVSGHIQIIRRDFTGNRDILADIGTGDLFAEAYACAGTAHLPVSAVAVEKSRVYWISHARLFQPMEEGKDWRSVMLENMVRILAVKNIRLNQKLAFISRRTIRQKLLSYLSEQALEQESRSFSIPFSRQELADFLCADRSALSSELGRLQREGILRFRKNKFILLRSNPE